jgi:ATP-dependent RNA helicase DDX51/DBP6
LAIQQKPLTTIYLIKTLGYKHMLCFVNSKESANRLNKLLQLNGIASMEYSSALHASRRTRIKTKFEQAKLDVLVCSDVMARGMDLSNVDYVLLYDAPVHLSSYVHKVGRTARAGRQGKSIVLLERKEMFFFNRMLKKIAPDHDKKLTEIKVKKSCLNDLTKGYKESLLKLKEELNKK